MGRMTDLTPVTAVELHSAWETHCALDHPDYDYGGCSATRCADGLALRLDTERQARAAVAANVAPTSDGAPA